MKQTVQNIVLLILLLLAAGNIFANDPEEKKTLKSDIERVWPLVEIVKAEYAQTTYRLERIEDKNTKNKYLEDYEKYVRNNYFGNVLTLNIRQGKLLLLLIHREIGITPFELLKTYLSHRRARFWQAIASLAGADLRRKYTQAEHPEIEKEIQHMKNKTVMILN
ncbi:MAG TPA: DUF4294 domain-containing protein [Prolixibacteraceae bacterium]|nr:DUF4294 domain-containing protein [Prolixibacteraceae bacterium]